MNSQGNQAVQSDSVPARGRAGRVSPSWCGTAHSAATNLALLSTAAFGAASLRPAEAQGGAMTNINQYANAQTLANDPKYKWAAGIKRVDYFDNSPTVTAVASAVLIAPDLYINAGHFTPRNGSQVAFHTELIFGPNYNTSTDRYTVRETQRFPGYIFGNKNTIDLGVGWTNNFVSGFHTPVTFAPFSQNQILTVAEYGNYGDINTGELPSQGDKLAGRARASTVVSSAYLAGAYFTTWFDGPNASDPLNVNAYNFASGAPYFKTSGNLTGLVIASSDGFGPGFTTVLNLTDSRIQNYLQPLIQDSWARFFASQIPGDANTDGSVNFEDLLTLAQNYGVHTGQARWFDGDFDANGIVDFPDLLALAQNYGASASVTLPNLSPELQSDWAKAQSIVPDPSSSALALAALSFSSLRRRR